MELFGFHLPMIIVWIVLIILFISVEALTMGLTTIWFAGGALAALAVNLLGGNIPLQVVTFIIVSLILLAFTRKIFVDKMKLGRAQNSLEEIIGSKGMMKSKVSPYEMGQVLVNGKQWSCIAKDDSLEIQKGVEVRIVAIEGVKLIVEPC